MGFGMLNEMHDTRCVIGIGESHVIYRVSRITYPVSLLF
jgi:hypothetical protein